MLIRFGVESLSGLLWNPYPLSRGIPVRIRVEYTGLPNLYFFSHIKGLSGIKAGERFGDKQVVKKGL
jgi:hypothetical protein